MKERNDVEDCCKGSLYQSTIAVSNGLLCNFADFYFEERFLLLLQPTDRIYLVQTEELAIL